MKKVYHDALKYYGEDAQKLMCVEECSELIEAILHERRNKCDYTDVITELADVEIMIHQMALIYGEQALYDEIEKKLARLDIRMRNPRKVLRG